METAYVSLAEKISKEVNLDSLPYIDKEVRPSRSLLMRSMMSRECRTMSIR